jgi:hypothetical protein
LTFEVTGSTHKIEGGGARIAENLEERVGLRRFGNKWFQNRGEVAGILMEGSFGGAGVGGGVAESWGATGGKGVVVGAEEAGGDGGGFHFPKNRAKGRGKASTGGEVGFFSGELKVKEGGVGDWF